MWAGLARAVAGGRLTDISHAVEEVITAEAHPYGIVDHYGGHGIGTEMHQDPHVLNYGRPGRGPKLVPGLVLAIEPMVTVGDPATVELEDGWTVVTKDGSRAAHFEHTVAITPEGPWVLTAEDGGAAGLAPYGITVRALTAPCRVRRGCEYRCTGPSGVGDERRRGVQWPVAFAPSCCRAVAA